MVTGDTTYNSQDTEYQRFLTLKNEIFQGYFSAVEVDNEYYNLDYPNQNQIIPKEWGQRGISPTIPPTARNAVDNLSDHILTSPKVFVPARPTDEDMQQEQDLAERKRQFIHAFWHQIAVQQGDPLNRAKKQSIKDGRIVLKKTLRWDLIPDAPTSTATRKEKSSYRKVMNNLGRSELIWRVKNCPTETILEDPADCYNPKYVYEFYKVYALDAREMYPEMEEHLSTYKDTDRVDYVEMWTKPSGSSQGRYVIWCKGERVHDDVNPYHWETAMSTEESPRYDGYVPYAIRDSGWGEFSAESKPEEKYVGVLRYAHPMLETEARQLTAVDIQMRFSTFAPVVTRNISEDTDQPIEIGPGKRINLMDDQEIEFRSLPDVPVSAFQLINKVHEYTNELSKASILSGTSQRGVDTATEADMNVRNAASKLQGPINALRSAIMVINRWVFQDIENIIESPVTVYGGMKGAPSSIEIAPKEIGGFYESYVELDTSDQASLNARNARLWADLYSVYQGTLSPQTAMEKGGIENPQEEMMKASVARLFLSEPAEQVRTMMMLTNLGGQAEDILTAYRNGIMQEQSAQQAGAQAAGAQPQQGGVNQATRPTQDQMMNPAQPIIEESQTNVQVDQMQEMFR